MEERDGLKTELGTARDELAAAKTHANALDVTIVQHAATVERLKVRAVPRVEERQHYGALALLNKKLGEETEREKERRAAVRRAAKRLEHAQARIAAADAELRRFSASRPTR